MHDRAVFNFLVEFGDVESCLRPLESALVDDAIVLGAFAADRPKAIARASPVPRYGPAGLAAVLGDTFAIVDERGDVQRTPSGRHQPFMWIAAGRRPLG